ncbi:hypothetical protein EES39_15480 [Streptomyces sp. ADI92-24]|nr:hypothetical protein EES39_15480 [Streptomyces sp. ADI92-24]
MAAERGEEPGQGVRLVGGVTHGRWGRVRGAVAGREALGGRAGGRFGSGGGFGFGGGCGCGCVRRRFLRDGLFDGNPGSLFTPGHAHPPFSGPNRTPPQSTELSRSTAKALRSLDDNDVDGLLKLLMGEKQFARFERYEITMQDIAAILEAYGKETGLGLGEG